MRWIGPDDELRGPDDLVRPDDQLRGPGDDVCADDLRCPDDLRLHVRCPDELRRQLRCPDDVRRVVRRVVRRDELRVRWQIFWDRSLRWVYSCLRFGRYHASIAQGASVFMRAPGKERGSG